MTHKEKEKVQMQVYHNKAHPRGESNNCSKVINQKNKISPLSTDRNVCENLKRHLPNFASAVSFPTLSYWKGRDRKTPLISVCLKYTVYIWWTCGNMSNNLHQCPLQANPSALEHKGVSSWHLTVTLMGQKTPSL